MQMLRGNGGQPWRMIAYCSLLAWHQGCYAPGRTLAVNDDVGEGRGCTRSAQHMRRVHAVTVELRQNLVAQRVAAYFGDQRRREAQARCGGQRVGAVAAALRLRQQGQRVEQAAVYC